MFRGIWQWAKDNLVDPITNLFRSQEDIDDRLDAKLGQWGSVVSDPTEIPTGAKLRGYTFISPDDAIAYLKGGIPAEYVTILKVPDYNEDGDIGYKIYVEETA